MPAPAIGGAIASIGGSLLSGGSRRRAAKRAQAALQQGNASARDAMLPAIKEATGSRLSGLTNAGFRIDAATRARLRGFDKARAAESAGIGRIRDLLNPYITGGQQGLSGLVALMGLNGAQAQTDAIGGIKTGGQFTELARQQEEALLANASATGGLRGGRTQDALASSRVNLLQGLIDKQLAGLGGLAAMGGNAANNLSGFEENNTRAMSGLAMGRGDAMAQGQLSQADLDRLVGETRAQGLLGAGQVNSDYFLNNGSIAAGGALAKGQANAQMFGGIAQGIGSVFGGMAPVNMGPGSAAKPAFGGFFGNFGFPGAR